MVNRTKALARSIRASRYEAAVRIFMRRHWFPDTIAVEQGDALWNSVDSVVLEGWRRVVKRGAWLW